MPASLSEDRVSILAQNKTKLRSRVIIRIVFGSAFPPAPQKGFENAPELVVTNHWEPEQKGATVLRNICRPLLET